MLGGPAEKAGERVRDISAPLAEEGISILFLSTYVSDYLLLKAHRLNDVTTILERSGFNFTANDEDDDDDETSSVQSPMSRHPSLSRSSTFGSARGGGHKGSASGSGSLAGSLVLSDRGSVGSRTGTTMSRTDSVGSRLGRTTSTSTNGGENVSVSDSPAVSATASTSTEAPRSSSPVALPAPTPFNPGENLTVLPDELVCVGLSLAHEELWRAKLLQAIFFPKQVLPPTPRQKAFSSSASMTSSFTSTASSGSSHSAVHRLRTCTSDSALSGVSTPRGPLSLSTMTQHPESPLSTNPSGQPRMSSSLSSSSSAASPNPRVAASLATSHSDYPIPFISLTQTVEGASLTADVRLLREVFKAEDDEMVYAVGGGLRGIWAGEEGAYAEASEGRGGENYADGGEEGVGEEEDEWQKVDKEDAERERRERLQKAKAAGGEGRILLKCLCLDLWAYGLGALSSVSCIWARSSRADPLPTLRQNRHRREPRWTPHRAGDQPPLYLHVPIRARSSLIFPLARVSNLVAPRRTSWWQRATSTAPSRSSKKTLASHLDFPPQPHL